MVENLTNTASAQHLLRTILAASWVGRPEFIPSAALVEVLQEFGISEANARAALSRLSRDGSLNTTKEGRNTFYGLSPQLARRMARDARRVFSYGTDESWDGSWTVVAFSLNEEKRDLRQLLRTRLRWMGLAPLFDGLWISPHAEAADVVRTLTEVGVSTATVMTAQENSSPDLRTMVSAWNLDEIRVFYLDFIERWQGVAEKVSDGTIGESQAMVIANEMMAAYRTIPTLEPELPLQVMPEGWPRQTARNIMVTSYEALRPLAEKRFKEIIGKYDSSLAAKAHRHSIETLMAGLETCPLCIFPEA